MPFGPYMFMLGISVIVYSGMVEPSPMAYLIGAALIGLPGFIYGGRTAVDRHADGKIFDYNDNPKELVACNDGKIRKFEITRDTDLRVVHHIEDPINKQVAKDLKRLGMAATEGPFIGSPLVPRSRGASFNAKEWKSDGMRPQSASALKEVLAPKSMKYPMAKHPRTPTMGAALEPGTYLMAAGDTLKMTIDGEESFYTCENAGMYSVINSFGQAEVHYVTDGPPPPQIVTIKG